MFFKPKLKGDVKYTVICFTTKVFRFSFCFMDGTSVFVFTVAAADSV